MTRLVPRFNRIEVLETHDHARFTDALELHVVELPKLRALDAGQASHEASLVRWSRFFAAKTDAEVEELAMSDPDIRVATDSLERLSADPDAQMLARQRELAMATYRIEMTAALEEGEAKGLREGEAKGLREGEAKGLREGEAKGLREGEAKGLREGEAKGLRVAIGDLCDALGIALDERRSAELAEADVPTLMELRAALKQDRRWPEPGRG